MKRSLSIFLLILLLAAISGESTKAQQLWKKRRVEAIAGLGPSFFFGDIGGFSKGENFLGLKDITFLQTRVNYNIGVKYRILQNLNARLSFTSGLLKATDERGSNLNRGLESSIKIFEPALIGEYYFIKNKTENSWRFSRGKSQFFQNLIQSLDFYAFTGFGGLSYSGAGNEELLKTGFPSRGFTGVIPFGAGTSLIYSPDFNFGVEISGRYTLSDYIDGYTSQYSSSNDVYYFLNFTFTYKLMTGPNGLPRFSRR